MRAAVFCIFAKQYNRISLKEIRNPGIFYAAKVFYMSRYPRFITGTPLHKPAVRKTAEQFIPIMHIV
ncbi:hypothetical protein, partial [Flexistipes sinusarabici]|uniref:hypothetical protein n=1 Tax=Flexistipes sinusarabici TaxID=2352 RepID=UPI0023580291